MNWIKHIQKFFKTNDALIWLIAINLAVFVLYNIFKMFFILFNERELFALVDHWLAVPADIENLIKRPWTIITYMFFHQGLWHILFNMLWLYWFGRIFRAFFSAWQLVNVYVFGGLVGAFFYVLSYNTFPLFAVDKQISILLGASGGVLAVVMAIACYVPKYTINLFILGRVKLIVIALVTIVIDIFSIANNDNAGGHIAHLGGAFFGYIFAVNIQKRRDITAWFGRFCAWIGSFFKPKPKLRVKYRRPPTDDREYNRLKHENQKEIDRILDKISKGGYESLTRQEKDMLFSQKK